MKWWLLFAGGGTGAILRYAAALWVGERAATAWPWGTFAVNAAGCLAIGIVATLADEHHWISPTARLFLVTGLLGGFTTFSTFGMETWQLVEDGKATLAIVYALGSLTVGLVAVITGVVATRALT